MSCSFLNKWLDPVIVNSETQECKVKFTIFQSNTKDFGVVEDIKFEGEIFKSDGLLIDLNNRWTINYYDDINYHNFFVAKGVFNFIVLQNQDKEQFVLLYQMCTKPTGGVNFTVCMMSVQVFEAGIKVTGEAAVRTSSVPRSSVETVARKLCIESIISESVLEQPTVSSDPFSRFSTKL